MEEDWLRSRLESGRSIESIARELDRDASTVSYWVKKYGLVSKHAERHAARGGIDREALRELVDAGLSTRAAAERLGVSQATVRHWLSKHGLETVRAKRRRSIDASLVAAADGDAAGECPRHGPVVFRRRSDGAWRCLKCRAEAVVARRRAVKAMLVADAGGACVLCGYSRTMEALQFHHRDPATKEFHIAHRGAARSIAKARAEAEKCILLCANCHAEVEAGIATIPRGSPVSSPG